MKIVASEAVREEMRGAARDEPMDLGAVIDSLAQTHRILLLEVYLRLLRPERDKAARAIRKGGSSLDDFYNENAAYVRVELGTVVDVFCKTAWAVGGKGPYPQKVEESAGKHTAGMVESHIALSRSQIEEDHAVKVDRGDYSSEMDSLAAMMKRECGLIDETENADGIPD